MIYLGVISSLILNLALFSLIKKAKSFSRQYDAFSELAFFKETALILNLTLMTMAIMRLTYFFELMRLFHLNNVIIIVDIIVSFTTMFLAGAIPATKSKQIHQLVGYIWLFSSIIFLFYFHFLFNLTANYFVVMFGKLLAFTMISGITFLYFRDTKWVKAEVFSIFMTLVWDIYILFGFLLK